MGARWIPITQTELIRALFHSLSTQNQATVVVRDDLSKDDGARGSDKTLTNRRATVRGGRHVQCVDDTEPQTTEGQFI